jgi:hypothetical protein
MFQSAVGINVGNGFGGPTSLSNDGRSRVKVQSFVRCQCRNYPAFSVLFFSEDEGVIRPP